MNTTPTQQPRVFILIVNWNGKDDTLACLHSLQNLAYRNYHIVLIDNASSDGSVQAIAEAIRHGYIT